MQVLRGAYNKFITQNVELNRKIQAKSIAGWDYSHNNRYPCKYQTPWNGFIAADRYIAIHLDAADDFLASMRTTHASPSLALLFQKQID